MATMSHLEFPSKVNEYKNRHSQTVLVGLNQGSSTLIIKPFSIQSRVT